jgi:hypothetical protein
MMTSDRHVPGETRPGTDDAGKRAEPVAVKEFAVTLPAMACQYMEMQSFPVEPVHFQCRQSAQSIVARTPDDVEIRLNSGTSFRAQLVYRRVGQTWWAMPDYSATGYSLAACKKLFGGEKPDRAQKESLRPRDCGIYKPLSQAVQKLLQQMQEEGKLL